jgi:hypothetical protein
MTAAAHPPHPCEHCAPLLVVIGDLRAELARAHHNAELTGDAISRTLEGMHSTTAREPARSEMVGDRLVQRG